MEEATAKITAMLVELHRISKELDESKEEVANRNVRSAIVYLECARTNLEVSDKFVVMPTVVKISE